MENSHLQETEKKPKPYFKLVQYLCVQESSEDSFAWCEQGGIFGLEFLGFSNRGGRLFDNYQA